MMTRDESETETMHAARRDAINGSALYAAHTFISYKEHN